MLAHDVILPLLAHIDDVILPLLAHIDDVILPLLAHIHDVILPLLAHIHDAILPLAYHMHFDETIWGNTMAQVSPLSEMMGACKCVCTSEG